MKRMAAYTLAFLFVLSMTDVVLGQAYQPYISRAHPKDFFVRKDKPYTRGPDTYEMINKSMLVRHFEQVYHRWHGPYEWDKYATDEYHTCLNAPVGSKETYERVAKFQAQKLVYIPGEWSKYDFNTNVWDGFAFKSSRDFKTQNELVASGKTLTDHKKEQLIGWDDDQTLQGLFESAFGGGKWHVAPVAHSISAWSLYPDEWRPWFKDPVDLEERELPYCGMVDDDLMYDFREENPFSSVLTHNKQGPFLYVYDFDLLRDRMREWTVHDTLIHGWKAFGIEEDENPSRIEYGPVLSNANLPAARAIRVQIFLKLYLAKLRIAKLLHPAPMWDETIGDYTSKYGYMEHADWEKKIHPGHAAEADLTMTQYIQLLKECPNVAYFKVAGEVIAIPTEVKDALKVKDWKTIRRVAKETQFSETMRDFYIYKMFVRSPIQKELDDKMYRTSKHLSIALWSGMSSYADHRHQFVGGIKNFYPFFERKDKRGHPHIQDAYDKTFKFRAAPTNTAGLVYAGHMDEHEFWGYLRATGKTEDQMWTDALNGPFMIVSSRTYARYGHAYFEKLAGHALKKVDVTGAMSESLSRVVLNPDPDLVRQLVDMDYFYYKKSSTDTRGTATMKSLSSMTLTKVDKVAMTDYDPVRVMRDPTADPAVASKDTSTAYFKAGKYNHIFKAVAKGLAKDEKQFPGMSIRMMNYMPYHTTYPKPLYGPKEYKVPNTNADMRNETLGVQWEGEPVRYPRQTDLVDHVIFMLDGLRGYYILHPEISQYVTFPTTPGTNKIQITEDIRTGRVGPVLRRARANFLMTWWAADIKKYMPGAGDLFDKERPGKGFMTQAEDDERQQIAKEYFAKRYFGMPRTPRHIDFIEEIAKMKREGVVEKVSNQYELQVLISERIPWLAMNPNLFMAYYKHVGELKEVMKKLSGMHTQEDFCGTGDGHLVWHDYENQGTGDALMAVLKEKHTSQTNMMLISYGYGAHPKGYTLPAVAGGRMRKVYGSSPEDFPKWLRFRPGISSAYKDPRSALSYNFPYIWKKNRKGSPTMLRDPEWLMEMKGPVDDVQGVAFFSKLMPGMTRFVNSNIIIASLSSYTGVWYKEGQFRHSMTPDARGWMVSREYNVRTRAWVTYQAYVSSKGKGFSVEDYTASSRRFLATKSALVPREGHTFVISDGILTTVTKEKKSYCTGAYMNSLYSGMEKL